MIPEEYKPTLFDTIITAGEPSAWKGLERIVGSIIKDFNINPKIALEFGVEYGFSTSALAHYFKDVVGVDTFRGDIHSGVRESFFEKTKENLKGFKNVTLVESSWEDFAEKEIGMWDLIHIDIVHAYKDTYNCGAWACEHSRVVMFHDTESFPEVRKAVGDLAKRFGRKFYNYPFHNGLGILA